MMEGENKLHSQYTHRHTGEEILQRVKQEWLRRITIAKTLSLNYPGFTSPRSLYCQIFFVRDRAAARCPPGPPTQKTCHMICATSSEIKNKSELSAA